MGLLNSNSLNEWATAIPDRARQMYQGLLSAPGEIKQLFDPKFQQGLLAQRSVTDKIDPQKAMAVALEATGMAPMGIAGHIVYHGSPHKFDKFDMSKIGTGEGAQAYGHGLYFAESPEVAKSYQKAGDYGFQINGKPLAERAKWNKLDEETRANVDGLFRTYFSHHNGDLTKVKQSLFFDAASNIPGARQAYTFIRDAKDFGTVPGAFYKVDIPDEAIPRMLDWDKPLNEQPAAMKALKSLVPMLDKDSAKLMIQDANKMTGAGLVTYARKATGGDNAASAYLKQQGIPGIRYLDGSSRTAGQGTSNYVLFDDALARILEVNGQSTGLLP